MTNDELKAFELEWLHEAELELSNSMDLDCRLGYEWDPEIYRAYRQILAELFLQGDLSKEDYDALVARIVIRHPEDDHDEHREKSREV